MWWHIHNLKKRIKHRETLRACERCTLLFEKHLAECPHCSGIDDERLEALLHQKSQARIGLGNTMFIIAAVIVVLMLVFNGLS